MKDRGLNFAHPASRVPCKQAHFSSLLLDFTLVRLLGALGGPLRRVVALYVVLGKSLWTLVSQLVFKFADGIGWLSAPPRNPVLRGVGRGIISVRRWHYTVGEAADPSISLTHASGQFILRVAGRYLTWTFCWHAAGILLYTAICRTIQAMREANDAAFQERKRLKRALEQASCYEEWSVAATKLDNVEGKSPEEKRARWRNETRLYDRRLLEERLKHLKEVRERGQISEMMFAVRADLLRNLGNMTNRQVRFSSQSMQQRMSRDADRLNIVCLDIDQLVVQNMTFSQHTKTAQYSQLFILSHSMPYQPHSIIFYSSHAPLFLCSELHEHFPTVPEPIREYIEEVQKHLEAVTSYDGPDMSLEDKLNFLRETRHAFGRTALVLSGGGALGAFHIVSPSNAQNSYFCLWPAQSACFIFAFCRCQSCTTLLKACVMWKASVAKEETQG